MEFKLNYQLEVAVQEGDLKEVVKAIHWSYVLVDEGYATHKYDVTYLPQPNENFKPFDELTDADIRTWLSDYVDFEQMENDLSNVLEEIKNPKIIMKELVKSN